MVYFHPFFQAFLSKYKKKSIKWETFNFYSSSEPMSLSDMKILQAIYYKKTGCQLLQKYLFTEYWYNSYDNWM